MKLPGPRPSSVQDLRYWLEHYHQWVEELEAGGLYRVDSQGTSRRSTRAGRPTESAAVHQAYLAERIQVVEAWLASLNSAERLMVERYLSNVTVRAISRQLQMKYADVAAVVRVLPALIYLEWYGAVDGVKKPS